MLGANPNLHHNRKGVLKVNLKDTEKMMQSEDFKERFKAEYFQLKIRADGLRGMLVKYAEGLLTFKPKCSYDMLNGQLKAMDMYIEYLVERAAIELIHLKE